VKELIPVIVGGAIGIFGTLLAVIGAYLLHRSGQSMTSRQLKRDKAERLVLLGYRTYDGISAFGDALRYGSPPGIASPTDEMRMLAAFYFPTLELDVHCIYEAERDFRRWALDHRRRELELNASVKDNEFSKHLEKVINAVVSLDMKVRTTVLPELI
jgi:hypothetical protein